MVTNTILECYYRDVNSSVLYPRDSKMRGRERERGKDEEKKFHYGFFVVVVKVKVKVTKP